MKLKSIRKELGINIKEITKITGKSLKTIYAYESGVRRPSIEILQKLSILYNCTIDELVNETDNKEESK